MMSRLYNFLKTVKNPAMYHGLAMSPPFFEGWYFKAVNASGQRRFAFIPGVFVGKTEADSHAFIQVLDGANSEVVYHRFPIDKFWASQDHFELRIDNNKFSLNQIELDINNTEQQVNGFLKFDNPIGWPVSLVSPGIMGWYAWVPRMECYHGVLGFDHTIEGHLQIDDQNFDFSGGRGYIEKDWGKAFPEAWVWMQTNHFSQPGTSLTASVAIIPWLGNAFAGFIVGLWQAGNLHRFATYANSKITHLAVDDHQIRWHVRNRTHQLEIIATQTEGALLQAPTPEGMGRRIAETLNASIHVRLRNLKSGKVEWEDTGKYAGLEAVGDLNKLIKMAL